MPEFAYQDPFPTGRDTTQYRKLTDQHVTLATFEGQEVLKVAPEALTAVAREAFRDVSFLYRAAHLEKVAAILDDPEASANDRTVALTLLRNAAVASGYRLPMCQDTGTATIVAKKGQSVWTGVKDEEWLARGIHETYLKENLRYSQTVPLSMFDEANSGTNLPAQIDIYASNGTSYEFLFVAKGGGSANKSMLFQETKALLNPKSLQTFLDQKLRSLGTAACPPYHLVVVIGGTSAEATMKAVKVASTGYYDHLPGEGNRLGQAFRDRGTEELVMELAARKSGIGGYSLAGKYFAARCTRRSSSAAWRVGVRSASASRARPTAISRQESIVMVYGSKSSSGTLRGSSPLDFARGSTPEHGWREGVDLNRPMSDVRAELSKYPVATPLRLSGTIVVARDIAHAKIKERLDSGEGMPGYLKDHPVYYAGPAKTPEGLPSGSFGPTTAGRMDSYVDLFQSHGGSMVMIAKGNRSKGVTDACKKHGGFYLGSIGGPCALTGTSITMVELLEYAELGMEAVYKIEVKDFPAFILVDDKGNEFFSQLPVLS